MYSKPGPRFHDFVAVKNIGIANEVYVCFNNSFGVGDGGGNGGGAEVHQFVWPTESRVEMEVFLG